ncbi:hypothetical protein LTR85_010628 [Meristemomyces frigidus]|nr:hypothetical protein LTR85_010628 [Meristemomyces frigidus]
MREESLPPHNYTDRISALLEHEDPEASDGGVDIQALARRTGNPGLQSDNLRDSLVREQSDYGTIRTDNSISTLLYGLEGPVGTPDQIVQMHNDAFNFLEPRQIVRYIRHGNRHRSSIVVRSDSDDENIFAVTGLSRRSQRRTPTAFEEIPDEMQDFMNEWLDLAVDFDSAPSRESLLPSGMEHFATMFRLHMPARLDSNSWIAEQLLEPYGKIDGEPGVPDGYFAKFELWMMANGGMGAVKQPNGTVIWSDLFLDRYEEDSIVFLPTYGVPRPVTEEVMQQHIRVIKRRRVLDHALISLSRRIASYVVKIIMLEYVLPEFDEQGQMVIDRRQLSRAVREILGAAWFDLPFDRASKLRDWSVGEVLKPAGQVVGRDVFLDQ